MLERFSIKSNNSTLEDFKSTHYLYSFNNCIIFPF